MFTCSLANSIEVLKFLKARAKLNCQGTTELFLISAFPPNKLIIQLWKAQPSAVNARNQLFFHFPILLKHSDIPEFRSFFFFFKPYRAKWISEQAAVHYQQARWRSSRVFDEPATRHRMKIYLVAVMCETAKEWSNNIL